MMADAVFKWILWKFTCQKLQCKKQLRKLQVQPKMYIYKPPYQVETLNILPQSTRF